MEVAEVTKLFENCFRLINIAYVNEFAVLCERLGISIWEVIDSAQTKPFGYMPFYPGPGIGGHCIPINPYFLFSKAREHDFHISFLELATGINEQMPYFTVSRIIEAISCSGKAIRNAKILVLGVAYKKDIGDTRESPALKLIELLLAKGADVSYNDPYVSQIDIQGQLLKSCEATEETLGTYDCVVIATDHSAYDCEMILNHSRLVFDAKGITRKIPGYSCGHNEHQNLVRLGEGNPGRQPLPDVTVQSKME
jgi:UDP-N-acetyl-D-glucosamine dehydrogenase